MPEHVKRCSRCRVEKPSVAFSKDRAQKDGLKRWCKSCRSEHYYANRDQERESNRLWCAENRERRQDQQRTWREANPTYHQSWREENESLARSYVLERRARIRSLPFETVLLREIALRDGNHCWMCGDELSEWNPAHLDHLIPLRASSEALTFYGIENPGTVRTNMALACPTCNVSKSNRVLLCAIARYIENEGDLVARSSSQAV